MKIANYDKCLYIHIQQCVPCRCKDVDGAVSQYYDIPSLSFRTSTYRLAMFNKEPGFRFKDLMNYDMIHPSAKGHRVMGELAIWLVQQTAIDLLARPYGKMDEKQAAESLPLPMMLGGSHMGN